MKLFVPPVIIDPTEGFTPENDIFKREAFGRGLANIVSRAEDNLVIAIDAPWGEGKTTFIQQWRGLLASSDYGINCIYFDAFAGDYQDDPLVAIASELYEYIATSEVAGKDATVRDRRKKEFLTGVKKWGKVALLAGLRVGVKAGSAGLVCLSDIEDGFSEVQKTIGEAVGKEVVKSGGDVVLKKLEHYFESQQELKRGLIDIHDALAKLAVDIKEESGKPLVFIIDELDRCRPDFALDLLERVKHIFSVPGIVYVLVCNSIQLEEHVKCRYGLCVQAKTYLTKFIDISLHLPKNELSNENRSTEIDTAKYVNYMLEKLSFPKGRLHRNTLEVLNGLSTILKLSFRDLERIFSYMALYHCSTSDNHLNLHNIVLGLCVARVKSKEIFDLATSGKACWEDVQSFFKFDELLEMESIVTSVDWFMREWRLCAELDKPITEECQALMNSLFRYNIWGRESLLTSVSRPFKIFMQE